MALSEITAAFRIDLVVSVGLPVMIAGFFITRVMLGVLNKLNEINLKLARFGVWKQNISEDVKELKGEVKCIKKDVEALKRKDAENDMRDIYRK